MLNQVDGTPSVVYIPKGKNDEEATHKAFATLVEAQQFLIDVSEKKAGARAYLFTNPLVFKM
jgi:hypothetical protein